MRYPALVALLFSFASAAEVVASGFVSGGFSMTDPGYFSEAPHIVEKPDSYALAWRYGKYGFFFRPESKVVEGGLLFSLTATSSSGNMRGRPGELPITNPKQIEALKKNGAFWLEPDGRRVRLEVKE